MSRTIFLSIVTLNAFAIWLTLAVRQQPHFVFIVAVVIFAAPATHALLSFVWYARLSCFDRAVRLIHLTLLKPYWQSLGCGFPSNDELTRLYCSC
jgi:hypothetical protein